MIVKVYKSGDNIEIYLYEKMVSSKEEIEEKEYKIELFEEKKDRKDERRKQTLRDNMNNLRRMARAYFTGKSFFVTLTFNDKYFHGVDDVTAADRKLKYFLKKLREEFGEVSYIAVRELQKKRQCIHYHMLLKNEKWTNYFLENNIKKDSQLQKAFEREIHKKYWIYGFVKIYLIDYVDNVGAYLSKYMSKELDWLKGRKLILKSTDIKKIEPLTDPKELHEIVQELDLYKSIAELEILNNEKRKAVFTNGYKSEYLGNITYYDINLKRLEKYIKND